MKAVDGGNPPRRSQESQLIVTVLRNLNDPFFENPGPDEVTVKETMGTGNRVYQFNGRDDDEVRREGTSLM